MIIGIDVRSLLEPLTGVGIYTLNLLEAIFKIDKKNEYWLFANSFKKTQERLAFFNQYPQVKIYFYRIPNKIFNLGLFLNYFKLDLMFASREKFVAPDLFFIPNHNFFSLTPHCPRVITFHDLSFVRYPEFYSPKSRLWHKMIQSKKLARESSKIIAVSENTKRDLIELYQIEADKIEVIYPGVKEFKPSLKKSKIREKYQLTEKFILYVGALEPRKNIEGLIQAFIDLDSSLKIDLVIAGPISWRSNQILRRIKEVKVKNRIKFVGFISEEDKYLFLEEASLFLYPSFYEGFGFPPLEAMSCSVPVVASFAPALGEILADAALLVDPYNINEITQAMKQILINKSLRQELIKKGQERSKKFSWEITAQKTLEVFTKTYFNLK